MDKWSDSVKEDCHAFIISGLAIDQKLEEHLYKVLSHANF